MTEREGDTSWLWAAYRDVERGADNLRMAGSSLGAVADEMRRAAMHELPSGLDVEEVAREAEELAASAAAIADRMGPWVAEFRRQLEAQRRP